MPQLSNRGQHAPASPIRRLTPLADAARARGVVVHQLNIGQPDLATSSTMRAAYRAFSDEVVAYSPSQGTHSLRQALASYYAGHEIHGALPPVTAEQVLVTVGGSEALLFSIAASCDPGDAILVAEPYYTNYRGFAHLLGCEVVPVPTRSEERFVVQVEDVAERITDRCRALVVPTPGNPTGAVLSAERLAELTTLCRERGLFFIVDEVYREFVYREDPEDDAVAPSALAVSGGEEVVVVIDSVSKRYSACGARVGCLVTRNATFYGACLRFAQARLSPPTVDQFAAEAALRTPAAEMRGNLRAWRQRRDTVLAGLDAIEGVHCTVPDGAFYLICTLPVDDADAFCRFLLEDFDLDGETLMLAPAEGFYTTPGMGRSEVRLAYVLDVPVLNRCLQILAAGLQAYADRAASR